MSEEGEKGTAEGHSRRLTYKGTAEDLTEILVRHANSPNFIDYKEDTKKPDMQKLGISYFEKCFQGVQIIAWGARRANSIEELTNIQKNSRRKTIEMSLTNF